MEAEKTLLKQLQRYYKVINEQHTNLNALIVRSKTHIESVQNLSEQYCACQHTDFDATPLGQLPDVKKNLVYKILVGLEQHLVALHKTLDEVEQISKKVMTQNSICTNTYRRHNTQYDYDWLNSGEPMRPSIASMMEWAEDIAQLFHSEYCERKFMLENLTYDQQKEIDAVAKHWTSLSLLNKTTQDILPLVSFFIKEDLK